MRTLASGGLRQKLMTILMVLLMMFSVCSLSEVMSVTSYAVGGDTPVTPVTPGTPSGSDVSSSKITITVSVQKDIDAFDQAIEAGGNLSGKSYKIKALEVQGDTKEYKFTEIINSDGKGKGSYTFDETKFNTLEAKSQQAFVTDLMRELKSAKYSSTITQEFSDGLSAADSNIANLLIPFVFDDLGADMATAYKWVAPVLNTLRVILGVLAIGVLLILVISTILDCCYIGLPIAREFANKNNPDAIGKKPFLISYDAYKTINEAESQMTGGEYKNPFGVYFKRRAVTYIILALCLFYLVAGEMSGLISWLLSMVSGITG